MALGLLYITHTAGYQSLPGVGDPSYGENIVMAVLVAGPGLTLLYGGYRLPQSDIRSEVFSTIVKGCLGGIGVILGLLALTALATGLRDPTQNILILTALGSVAGFAAGIHDAQTKTRDLELQETVDQLRSANKRLERLISKNHFV